MADDKKTTIIIKKVKGGGHGAPHGGAWKVAFADFMTAMMAFFLVMWLMGSDEEIKAAVAQYFSNPSSAYRPELANANTVPLGDKTGAGDVILSGAQGLVPEDLINRPSRQFRTHPEPKTTEEQYTNEKAQNVSALEILDIDRLHFSLREDLLFDPGSDQIKESADRYLKKVGKILKGITALIQSESFKLPE